MSFTVHRLPMTQIDCRFLFFRVEKKCIITNLYIVPTLLYALFELLPGEPCKEKRLPHEVAVGMVDDQKRFSILIITCLICRYADRSRFEKSSAHNADEPVDLVKSQIRHERSIVVIIATIIIFLWKIG